MAQVSHFDNISSGCMAYVPIHECDNANNCIFDQLSFSSMRKLFIITCRNTPLSCRGRRESSDMRREYEHADS